MFLGFEDGTKTTATVTGAGSRWDGIWRMTIGGTYHTDTTGHGILNILNGGERTLETPVGHVQSKSSRWMTAVGQ